MPGTTALAAEAIAHEGVDAYYGDLILDVYDAITALAAYLDDNPEAWTAASADCAWEFHGDLDDLAGYIRATATHD
jgi:hypothetical protein